MEISNFMENFLVLSDLKEVCRALQIPVTGNKSELVNRIHEHESFHPRFLKKLKKKQLKNMSLSIGVKGTGSKKEQLSRILGTVLLTKLKTSNLKDVCRVLDLQVTGKRNELLDRILNHECFNLEIISKMNTDQLKEMCLAFGLNVSGTKTAKINRIYEYIGYIDIEEETIETIIKPSKKKKKVEKGIIIPFIPEYLLDVPENLPSEHKSRWNMLIKRYKNEDYIEAWGHISYLAEQTTKLFYSYELGRRNLELLDKPSWNHLLKLLSAKIEKPALKHLIPLLDSIRLLRNVTTHENIHNVSKNDVEIGIHILTRVLGLILENS